MYPEALKINVLGTLFVEINWMSQHSINVTKIYLCIRVG